MSLDNWTCAEPILASFAAQLPSRTSLPGELAVATVAQLAPVTAQLIIERAYAGEKDHVKHALDLFVDFAAIFVRILVRRSLIACRDETMSSTHTEPTYSAQDGIVHVAVVPIDDSRAHGPACAGNPHPEAAAGGGGTSPKQAQIVMLTVVGPCQWPSK